MYYLLAAIIVNKTLFTNEQARPEFIGLIEARKWILKAKTTFLVRIRYQLSR
jgi:hypothetical protein